MTCFVKPKHCLFFCMLIALCSCINREFDSNEEYTKSESIPLVGDNDRLLSRIFIINSNHSYLWFDINNEVANFSKPELTLPMNEGSVASFRRIPLRGLLYEYNASENEITFKNIPEQFVQINNERLSLTFKLTPADNKEILLPNKSTVITSKKQCFLTLKRVLFDGDSNAFEIEEKIKRGGRTYEFLPFKAELTLIN
ncbi:MAG: hypothetical protein HXN47_07715 [Prevotella nanceiensis]|uniref:Lipoprotein n=2 Tax=Hoylesella TaxID=2974257 RepID=A0ABS6YDM1_9BACT|nr:hypothetical protein [Hoylesella nanceiensis]RKW52477.1 MAG: hypothetical protein D8H98_18295 [Prevotella sp.]MBF1426596.1 hypothetical protein [Hoylesella nanceiensis]MBF1433435.1 hypothetical protein [Hoylesella nanceiensis]MBF1439206.1 hypothetical protein [Hoylesella nanceiensis]MBW4766128.1 hypothetical protein [Hoylesella nanceiensis]